MIFSLLSLPHNASHEENYFPFDAPFDYAILWKLYAIICLPAFPTYILYVFLLGHSSGVIISMRVFNIWEF